MIQERLPKSYRPLYKNGIVIADTKSTVGEGSLSPLSPGPWVLGVNSGTVVLENQRYVLPSATVDLKSLDLDPTIKLWEFSYSATSDPSPGRSEGYPEVTMSSYSSESYPELIFSGGFKFRDSGDILPGDFIELHTENVKYTIPPYLSSDGDGKLTVNRKLSFRDGLPPLEFEFQVMEFLGGVEILITEAGSNTGGVSICNFSINEVGQVSVRDTREIISEDSYDVAGWFLRPIESALAKNVIRAKDYLLMEES